MKKVPFIVTSATVIGVRSRPTGYEFSEVAHPYFALKQRGYEVDFASPAGGAVPEDGYDEADQDSRSFHTSVAPFAAHVEIEGNLITGQNPTSARAVEKAIADLIERYDPQS